MLSNDASDLSLKENHNFVKLSIFYLKSRICLLCCQLINFQFDTSVINFSFNFKFLKTLLPILTFSPASKKNQICKRLFFKKHVTCKFE